MSEIKPLEKPLEKPIILRYPYRGNLYADYSNHDNTFTEPPPNSIVVSYTKDKDLLAANPTAYATTLYGGTYSPANTQLHKAIMVLNGPISKIKQMISATLNVLSYVPENILAPAVLGVGSLYMQPNPEPGSTGANQLAFLAYKANMRAHNLKRELNKVFRQNLLDKLNDAARNNNLLNKNKGLPSIAPDTLGNYVRPPHIWSNISENNEEYDFGIGVTPLGVTLFGVVDSARSFPVTNGVSGNMGERSTWLAQNPLDMRIPFLASTITNDKTSKGGRKTKRRKTKRRKTKRRTL